MHNTPLLMSGRRDPHCESHPDDAEEHGIEDGGEARLGQVGCAGCGRQGDRRDDGTVALPHGWGHRGGWQLANEHGGANVNLLASSDPEDLEPLAGMAFLNGIPVRVEALSRVEGAAGLRYRGLTFDLERSPHRSDARAYSIHAQMAGLRDTSGLRSRSPGRCLSRAAPPRGPPSQRDRYRLGVGVAAGIGHGLLGDAEEGRRRSPGELERLISRSTSNP